MNTFIAVYQRLKPEIAPLKIVIERDEEGNYTVYDPKNSYFSSETNLTIALNEVKRLFQEKI